MLRPTVYLYVTLAACASTALAGLYGTSPVANTVWSAGHSESVSWIDDKSAPRLSQLDSVDIDLYSGNDHFIATLAQGVNPKSKAQDVWISPSWGHNGSDYYVKFSSQHPPMTVYTACFTIVDMADVAAYGPQSGQSPNNSGITVFDSGYYTPYVTFVLPNSTSVTALAPQRTTARPSSTLAPITPEDEDAYLHQQVQKAAAAASKSAAGSIGHGIDFERLKFRLVFIFWPALVGITMAL